MATGKLTKTCGFIRQDCSGVKTTANAYKKMCSVTIPQSGIYIINGHWQWGEGASIWSVGRITTDYTGELYGTVVRNEMTSGAGMNTFFMGPLVPSFGRIYFELYTSGGSYTVSGGGLTVL